MESKTVQRVQKWDNIKCFLLFCMVLGHVAEEFTNSSSPTMSLMFVIYSFHMPLFLFVSGLFEKKNIKERRYNRIFSYLVLSVLVKALVLLSNWIAYGEFPGINLLSTANVAWYAFVLFVFSFIIIAIDKFDPRYVFVASIIIACVACYDKNIGDYLCLSRIIVYFPFYYLGYLLNPKDVLEFFEKKILKVIAPIIVLAYSVWVTINVNDIYDYKYCFTARKAIVKIFENEPYSCIIRLGCYGVSFLIGCCVIAIIPKYFCKGFFAKIGARSLSIYALNSPVKHLFLGLINDKYNLVSYFPGVKIVIFELLVSIGVFVICALPIWEPILRKLINVPLKRSEN